MMRAVRAMSGQTKTCGTFYAQTKASEFFLRRLIAFVIDMAVCFLLLWLTETILGSEQGVFSSDRSDLTKNILFSLCMVFVMLLSHGYTLGKRIVRLRVMQMNGRTADLLTLFSREFFGRLLVEKSNLFLVYLLTITQAMEPMRARLNAVSPWLEFASVALISLPWGTFVSCAFALCRPDGRTLHDMISGTRLVGAEGFGRNRRTPDKAK